MGKETLFITNTFRHRLENNVPHKQHLKKATSLQEPTHGKFCIIWHVQIDLPRLPQSLRGTDWRCFSVRYKEHKCASTTATLKNSHTTSMRKYIPLAPLTTLCRCYITKGKGISKHNWEVLRPQGTRSRKPSEWRPNHLSQKNLWLPHLEPNKPHPSYTLRGPDPNTPYIPRYHNKAIPPVSSRHPMIQYSTVIQHIQLRLTP